MRFLWRDPLTGAAVEMRSHVRLSPGSLCARRFLVLDEAARARCDPYTADDFDAISSTHASARLRDAGFHVLDKGG